MNFSPEQMRMAQEQMKNMSDDDLKAKTNYINSLSDEQLKSMAAMSGQNIDPSMFRQASQMFQNMSPEQMNQMRNMSGNQFGNNRNYNTSNSNNYSNQSNTNNTSYKTNQNTNTQQNSYVQKGPLDLINKLKIEGNDFFKKQDFEAAKSKYQEGIFEIEEIRMTSRFQNFNQQQKNEVQTLEIALRMNYANILAKQQEFLLVQDQAKQVLLVDPENGKGNFRMGQALYYLEKYDKSKQYIEKAAQILKNDENIQKLKSDLYKKLGCDEQQGQKKETEQQKEPQRKQEEQKEQQQEQKQEKQEKPNNEEQKVEDSKNIQKQDDVEIKEEKEEETKEQYSQNQQNTSQQQNSSMPQFNSFQQQQFDQFKNMSPEQMDFMVNQMKSMDTQTIKQMYQAQGMTNISDEQIEATKQMMTPEYLNMVKNMNFDQVQSQMNQQQQYSQSQNNSNVNTNTNTNPNANPMASMMGGDFDPSKMNKTEMMNKISENPDMIKMAMQQMKQNPELFKNMAKSMGPAGKMFENSSPEDMERMINMMTKVTPLITYGTKAFSFFQKNKYIMLGLLGLFIVYYFF